MSMLLSTGIVGSITTNSADASGEVIDLGEGSHNLALLGSLPSMKIATGCQPMILAECFLEQAGVFLPVQNGPMPVI